MHTNHKKYLSAFCLAAGLITSQASFAENKNAISLGYMINPIGSLAAVGYERMVVPGFSVGGRYSSIDYDYWDGAYNEWGSGGGVEVSANYHFRQRGFSGPYIGVSVGQVDVDWSWYEAGSRGYGTSNLTSFMGTFGWDFDIGSGNFVIRPSVILGSYAGAANDNTGTKKSSIGAVFGGGVAAVIAF